jgi:hypothetical protein
MILMAIFFVRWIVRMRPIAMMLAGAAFFAVQAYGQFDASKLPAGVPLFSDDVPPGVIGAMQLKRQPNLCGYLQPVELRGPAGSGFALASNGTFADNQEQPLRAAVLVGAVYRFRMIGIPGQPETELFPTLEVIDRTYPPAEREHRFPIPIEIDDTDIAAALRGDLVTRVIYLEDGTNAEPVSYAGGPMRIDDVGVGQDTLRAADTFGRPLAILRIGSRIPDIVEGDGAQAFLYGSPPWQAIKNVPKCSRLSDITVQYSEANSVITP